MMPDPIALTAEYQVQKCLSCATVTDFQAAIYRYYHANPRPMAWRETNDPYAILVSEIMLQQTQVERVKTKYDEFLTVFPTSETLATSPLPELLRVWQGLGYNRRALALQRCAQEINSRFDGQFPSEPLELESLPGIGPYTARAVGAFAFGRAEPLIETNIRTVIIHCFFYGHEQVPDKALLPLVDATLDRENPRQWYYALMDYGVLLKRQHPNPSRRSSHHARQSTFEGSNRQQRSHILRLIMQQPCITTTEICQMVYDRNGTVENNLMALQREGFLEQIGEGWRIP